MMTLVSVVLIWQCYYHFVALYAFKVSLLSAWYLSRILLMCSIAPTLGRIITELLRPALWTLLVIGDGGLVAPDNPGSEPWRLICGQ